MVRLALVLARKPEINQLDIFMFIEQYVFELQISVDTGLLVDVGYGADQLGKNLLDLIDGERAVFEKIIVEFVTWEGSQ